MAKAALVTVATDLTWLASFSAPAGRAAEASVFGPAGQVARAAQVDIVVEVTRKRRGEWLVVFAELRPADDGLTHTLSAKLAFSDSSTRCDKLNRDGLPAFEAEIEHDRRLKRLSVTIQAIAGDASLQATRASIVIAGLPIDAPPDPADDVQAAVRVELHFDQTLASPSPIDPGGQVDFVRAGARAVGWFQPPATQAGVHLTVPALRFPDLSPLDAVQGQSARTVWRGNWHDRQSRRPNPPVGPPRPPARQLRRAQASKPYEVPASFRFESVEWLGFRLDLRDTGALPEKIDELLGGLLAGLNAGQDRFVAVSSTINIDLLRYGRMKLNRPATGSKLTGDEYCSQHELVLRVAVRRRDAVAGAAAVHVPAIFVDNPWSRSMGREFLGFDKRMIAVYDEDGRQLRDRGNAAAAAADAPVVALSQVREIMLRDRPLPLKRRGRTARLLGLSYTADPDRASFIEVADERLMAPSARASFGWRAGEFAGEADDAFAADVRVQRISGYLGVQSAPVDGRELPRAIVESRIGFHGVGLAFPDGLATLSLGSPQGAPPAWRLLNEFLDAHGGTEVTLPAGDWYRMRCDMRLEVIDPLGW